MKIQFDKAEFKRKLKKWVDFETPTGDEERLSDFSSLVFHEFKRMGASAEVHPLNGGPLIHAVYGNGKRRCVLMGHMDTVFPFGEAEKYDEENGRMYGAGVLDMKGGLLLLVKAFEETIKHLPDDWRIEALINSDEERGSSKSREKMQTLLQGADLVFSFEGNRENCVTVSRKGVWTFEITSRGIAAHTSAGADKRKSAVYHLTCFMHEMFDTPLPENVSMNIGVIEGGKAANIVPDRARLTGEIRGETEESLKIAEERIKNCALKNACEYRPLTMRPPMMKNEKTMRVFERIKDLYPGLTARSAGGGGDAAFAVLSGAYTMDGMGLEGARAHTRREYVTEESIERRYAFSVRVIEKCMREFDHL